MIVGLTKKIPFVLHASLANHTNSNWLIYLYIYEEFLRCIDCLQSAGYNARACASDNHPSNVVAYQKLLLKYAMDSNDDLRICINGKPICLCLFHDSVHIIKNIRNNLLNKKRLIFSPFSCDYLKYFPVGVNGGEITWAFCMNCTRKINKVRQI